MASVKQPCGPDVFTLGEIVAKVAERLHRSIKIIPLSNRISKIQAVVLDRFSGQAVFSG
ncbi:MAG: hypothetical protein ACNYPI_10740 [Arenicellales bacterium WSBS_2016_MAG_OTU3]